MKARRVLLRAALTGLLGAFGCGGGGSGSGGSSPIGDAAVDPGCTGDCNAQVALDAGEVQLVIRSAVAEAQARGVSNATIAVVDRVGNVLAVFQMSGAGAADTTRVDSGRNTGFGLDGVPVAVTLAAISKAGTAAYLSSQGNAFTTRTASFIVQEHFAPGESLRPGGPLFGVQFSQLPCGDFVRRAFQGTAGPQRMPLGFAADPGGLPLYKAGVPVGGVGIEFDGVYGADLRADDEDVNLEERVATAASRSFAAPTNRRAEQIIVDGRRFPFADDEAIANAPLQAFADLDGGLVPVNPTDALSGFWDGTLRAGTPFLTPAAGFIATSFTVPQTGQAIPGELLFRDGAVFPSNDCNNGGGPGFPNPGVCPPPTNRCEDNVCDSLDPLPAGGGLLLEEVRVILISALDVAFRARAQIRNPPGQSVRVNVSVVDLRGNIIGFGRSQDAPVFGADVSIQKARTATFFSSTMAAANLQSAGLDAFVTAVRSFFQDDTALANGIAFSDRAGGNLSRPFFPDGDNESGVNGPLSRPFPQWSPFGTGLQLDAVLGNIVAALGDPADAMTIRSCTDPADLSTIVMRTVRNGYQIFPGSVPIYRGNDLIGGLGVSGDGVDQDDLVAFLGLHNAGAFLATGVGNAPQAIRADTVPIPGFSGLRLRYVNCPPSAFLGENADDDVCNGK